MADYHFDPLAPSGGDGSQALPYNSFSSYTTGAHRYLLRRNRPAWRETFTFLAGTNGAYLGAYGDGSPPVIDCENTRANAVNLNSRSNCEIEGITFVNHNAGAPDGAIRVSGSGHYIHHCQFVRVRIGVHGANTAGHRVERNRFDIGNPLTPNSAFAVRFDGVSCLNNRVRWNYVTSTAPDMTFMASLQLFNCGAGNRIEFNELYGLLCDGPSLRSGTTGCFLVGNLIYGPRILDALVVEGSSNNFIWNNTAVNSGDVPGHFGPALKMGDEFSTGTPSANNDVANNLWVSLGPINNVMNLVTIGTGNTFRGNRLWRPNGGNIVNLNTGSGTSSLTFAAWQAAGFSTSETFGDPGASESWRPVPGSPLLQSAIDLGPRRDLRLIQGRRFIGAHAAATFRNVP